MRRNVQYMATRIHNNTQSNFVVPNLAEPEPKMGFEWVSAKRCGITVYK